MKSSIKWQHNQFKSFGQLSFGERGSERARTLAHAHTKFQQSNGSDG